VLLLLLLLLLLLHEIGWHLLLDSTIEGVPVHVNSLPCSYLKSLDFFSQGFIQSCRGRKWNSSVC
jgi:lipopolysaccharide biosynthesis regulator YciM